MPETTSGKTGAENALVEDGPDVAELRRGVLFLLRRKVQDPALAEDLCGETFRIVFERMQREPLEDPTKLPAFLAQTARNLAIAEWRKRGRQNTVTGEEAAIAAYADDRSDAAAELLDRQRAEAVRRVLEEMGTPRDRELLTRYYLRDEDKVEICQSLGLTEAHFHRVIFRARERFRALLEARHRQADLLCLAL
ncbi:MAG: sigma-70 family RNA polymerase sigma factor [Planctomycetes bacterium]|nr:sigma-70 family RNA polymerase sigma factor [Planctomycetota bacterium]